jgi:hypothetical protein
MPGADLWGRAAFSKNFFLASLLFVARQRLNFGKIFEEMSS